MKKKTLFNPFWNFSTLSTLPGSWLANEFSLHQVGGKEWGESIEEKKIFIKRKEPNYYHPERKEKNLPKTWQVRKNPHEDNKASYEQEKGKNKRKK